MPVDPARFPFVTEFLEQRSGTLYVLCDSPVRIRDAVSVVTLTGFFAAAGVRLDVRPVLTRHRRYLSAWNVKEAITAERAQEFKNAYEQNVSLDDLIDRLFTWAEISVGGDGSGDGPEIEELVPRGPIILLGRPQLYPSSFTALLTTELSGGAKDLFGRFKTRFNTLEEGDQFWSVFDQYYNVTHSVARRQWTHDYGIIRKVRGAFSSRTILFAYGTSSLGTIGATQMLVDQDQNEQLVTLGIPEHLLTHGEAEILVEVKLQSSHQRPSATISGSGHAELRPRELQIFLGPSPPISTEAADWIKILTVESPPGRLGEVYRLKARDATTSRFTVIGSHPDDAISAHMIGGRLIQGVVERLKRLGKDLARQPVLLEGPTGAGKELAAHILFEQRALALLDRMKKGALDSQVFPDAPILGARFSALNCAGMDDLAESRLFGIKKETGTNVAPSPGAILAAGEGTVFLDEISFMNEVQQGRLLRAVEPPFEVVPLGMSAIPYGAAIVAATSSDPGQPVGKGGLLPELLARFYAVGVPSLADRPGDVPALLCAIAGRPIVLSEQVLRCLIADRHPRNVRGLFAIVRRAIGDRDPSSLPPELEITLPDLGASNELQEHFRLAERGAGVAKKFVFELPPSTLVPWAALQAGVAMLTTLVRKSDGAFQVRAVSSERAGEFLVKAEPSIHENVAGWIRAVRQTVDSVQDVRLRKETLHTLSALMTARFGNYLTPWLRSNLLTVANTYGVQQNHLADSTHNLPSTFSPSKMTEPRQEASRGSTEGLDPTRS